MVSERTQYTPREERAWFLRGWLGLIIVYNLFTIVSFLTGGSNPLAYLRPAENANDLLILIVNLGAAAAIIFSVVILAGYKLGYYGLVAAFVVMTIVSLMIGFNLWMVLVAGLVALITWALMRPTWNSMK